jgi:hypothetical protein
MADHRWVIGNAHTNDPWLLNLDPYPNQDRAQRAIYWQRIGQGQFDPPEYWKIVTTDELQQLLPSMDRSPYTEEAWARFKETINVA